MSAFWDSMSTANDAAIETMGEDVTIGDVEMLAIVDPLSFSEGPSAGGRRAVVRAVILVRPDTFLADGLPVIVRGAYGKVERWEQLGPDQHLNVTIGPFNRWDGEIPGV